MNQSIDNCNEFGNYMNENFKYNFSEMIICPSYIHLNLMNELFTKFQIQNILNARASGGIGRRARLRVL